MQNLGDQMNSQIDMLPGGGHLCSKVIEKVVKKYCQGQQMVIRFIGMCFFVFVLLFPFRLFCVILSDL